VGAAVEQAHVRSAVRELPASQREAIALTYWGGFTSSEIARDRELPLGTVKSRVRLGLRRLRSDGLAASSTH
jgi:RNA polymerase sigma-70 factor (ECF subfamily)